MQHGGGSNANAEVKRTRLGNKGQYQGIRDVAQALRGTGGTRGQGALPRVRACPGVYSHCRHDLRNSSAIRALQRKGIQGALPRGTRVPRCLHTLQARLGGVLAQSALHRGKAGTGQLANHAVAGKGGGVPSESRCQHRKGCGCVPSESRCQHIGSDERPANHAASGKEVCVPSESRCQRQAGVVCPANHAASLQGLRVPQNKLLAYWKYEQNT